MKFFFFKRKMITRKTFIIVLIVALIVMIITGIALFIIWKYFYTEKRPTWFDITSAILGTIFVISLVAIFLVTMSYFFPSEPIANFGGGYFGSEAQRTRDLTVPPGYGGEA